jgi:hypothetical protein
VGDESNFSPQLGHFVLLSSATFLSSLSLVSDSVVSSFWRIWGITQEAMIRIMANIRKGMKSITHLELKYLGEYRERKR